jgi:hypothetical protein
MILDFLNPWRTDCPAAARELGLLHEHRAIARRHERMKRAWASHLQASREAILAAALRCPQLRSVLVIGAGDCLDVPVAELAVEFERVVLADVVIGREARRLAKILAPKVRCEAWDASGALAAVAARKAVLTPAEALAIFESAHAGPPPGGEADLVVSANCISQLGLVPGHSLPAKETDSGLPDRCARAAARRHLQWLAARSGVRVLLADMARLNLSPEGRVIKRENLSERYGLAQPDRQWRWNLAPIPEWAPDYARVHEVGAWIYAS